VCGNDKISRAVAHNSVPRGTHGRGGGAIGGCCSIFEPRQHNCLPKDAHVMLLLEQAKASLCNINKFRQKPTVH